jgi:hypothetical protein
LQGKTSSRKCRSPYGGEPHQAGAATPPAEGDTSRHDNHPPTDHDPEASPRAAREAYVTTTGWQHDRDTLAAEILNRWPTTPAHELGELLELAARREAEELGTA